MVKHGQPPFLECSSKGDARFSAFRARIQSRGNRSIEEIYQGAKIFDGGKTGLDWRAAKGKQCLNQEEVRTLYAKLWDEYIEENPQMHDAIVLATRLSDVFGQPGHACQASELWRIRETLIRERSLIHVPETPPEHPVSGVLGIDDAMDKEPQSKPRKFSFR